jgi:hypothetical protein
MVGKKKMQKKNSLWGEKNVVVKKKKKNISTTNTQCAAVHCSTATKMASVKRVTDKTTSRLTASGTNLLCFKTRQAPVTHPVFKRGVKIVSSL